MTPPSAMHGPSSRPSVSVAMTTYNGERFLAEQLESIGRQAEPPDELVIADDGSTDATVEIARDFAVRANFDVRIVGNEVNQGLRLNIERALRNCNCQIIALSDQDDVWSSDRLALIRSAFESIPDLTLWFGNASLIDELGRHLGKTTWEAVHLSLAARDELLATGSLRRLLMGMTVTGALMAFRADVRNAVLPLPDDLDGPEHLYLHDGWISILAAVMGSVWAEPRIVGAYRQHPLQATSMSMAYESDAPASRGRQLLDESRRLSLVLARLKEVAPIESRAGALEYLEELSGYLQARLMRGRVQDRYRVIACHWARGAYSRHGNGMRTALGDILRPPAGW